MAYFDAQYGATSGEVLRPQPLERFTITPLLRATIAGTNARIDVDHALHVHVDEGVESSAGTSHSGAGLFMTAALLMSKSGGPDCGQHIRGPGSTAAASVTSSGEVVRGGERCCRVPGRGPAPPAPDDGMPRDRELDNSARPRPARRAGQDDYLAHRFALQDEWWASKT